MTYGERYGPAMKITDQVEADAYFEKLVAHWLTDPQWTREMAEAQERLNLGYWAGYYGAETRERVDQLFCKIAERGQPTAKEAFEMGLAMGENARAGVPGGRKPEGDR